MATITGARPAASAPAEEEAGHIPNLIQSHPYTCNTCQVAFRSSDLQRAHMRTDWHRYNLKRRVASLPPLSSEVFAEKVLNAQASSSAVAARASFEKHCPACAKTYYSENAFQNHLGSQKHKLRSAILAKDGQTPTEDEGMSVMSSTISLGEPIRPEPNEPGGEAASKSVADPPRVPIDAEAEREFSKVIDGIKDARLSEDEPLSRRPTRPHHYSSNKERPEHPLSPEKGNPTTSPSSPSSIPLRNCLFCNYESPTFKLSVLHMTKIHSMFIPEQPYLVDLEGLISWLYTKIHSLHECLYCHKLKPSPTATQTHMRDTGHCAIAFESPSDMLSVGQFYDFRSTYSHSASSSTSSLLSLSSSSSDGGISLPTSPAPLKTTISTSTGDEIEIPPLTENAEGWETDSSASSLSLTADGGEFTAVPIDRSHMYAPERLSHHRHHTHGDDPRPHRSKDGFHSHAHHRHIAAFYSDNELFLPSGRTAGHRSLKRYWRQNLRGRLTPNERVEREQRRLLMEAEEGGEGDVEMGGMGEVERIGGRGGGREIATRANGGLGMVGVSEQKKREVRAVEKREVKRSQRREKQYQWGVDRRGNNQKHFRDPLLQ